MPYRIALDGDQVDLDITLFPCVAGMQRAAPEDLAKSCAIAHFLGSKLGALKPSPQLRTSRQVIYLQWLIW